MHHLLTGHDPCTTPFVFPDPRSLNPDLSERAAQIILKAVSLRPQDRFPSAAEMRQALAGEVVMLEEVERFGYGEEPAPPREMLRQGSVVLGSEPSPRCCWRVRPVFLSFSVCYLAPVAGPDGVGVPLPAGGGHAPASTCGAKVVRYQCGQRVVEAPWSAVTSIAICPRRMLGVRVARVQTDTGTFGSS